jgi:DNA-directed RNA polymerase specialized sigma54-like protein
MSDPYKDWAISSSGLMVKDPVNIFRLNKPEENEQATLCIIIDHYEDQGTIPEEESTRFKELVNSVDKENMEVVKAILQEKYKIL